MNGKILGWAAGGALALAITLAIPSLDVIPAMLLGFGLTALGVLIGTAADGGKR